MTLKEKIILMVVVVALVLVVMTFTRLSDDALGMLLGVMVGLVVTVPALVILAWFAGRSHAEERARHQQTQEAFFDLLRQQDRHALPRPARRRPVRPRSLPSVRQSSGVRRLPTPEAVILPPAPVEEDEDDETAEMW